MKKSHWAGKKRGEMSDEHRAKISAALKGHKGIDGAGKPKNTPEILWSKVEKHGPDECWPWLGNVTEGGYGRTWINGRGYYAHRVIFSLQNPGLINLSAPKKLTDRGFLLHSCDNPICCNPQHLAVGTHLDNEIDKKNKNRTPDYSGDRGPRCKLTMVEAREIRRLRQIENIPARELAKRYEISLPSIKSLLRGTTYKE